MKILRDSRNVVLKARLQWINTMNKTYPGFNPKLWEKNSTYRANHPQGVLA